MYNKVTLIGRLVRDAELKYTNSGKAAANFTLAVDRGFKDKETGESTADFIKCVAWDKTAENVANFTKKGSLVLVEGSIKTGSYDRDGVKVFTTDIQASRVLFMPSGKGTNSNNATDDVEDVFGDDFDAPF